MDKEGLVLFFALLVLAGNGCMRFTQHDYDLQQNAYQREQQQQAQRDQDQLQMRW